MDSALAVSPPRACIDARPILPRTLENIWSRAERERDRLYDVLAELSVAEGIEPLLLKSAPFVFPLWVKVEFWVPSEGRLSTHRAGATIVVQTKPCHRHEFEYSIAYAVDGKQKSVERIQSLDEGDLRQMLRFLLRKGRKPMFVRFRTPGSFAFWRPTNKIDQIRSDYLAALGLFLVVLSFFMFQMMPLGDGSATAALAALTALFSFGGGLWSLWRATHRPLLVHCEGKPDGEPRVLGRVDSWQTVIFGIGDREGFFRSQFLAKLGTPPTERFRWHVERVWYWGLDGKEEREQIVLIFGRGLVYCQIYQYGNDLYVGWDGNVNYGQWVETPIGKGIDRKTRKLTSIMSVNPGTQVVSEYDLIDLNCLMEWTHAQIVKIAKEFIAELKIDQEIDFTILRGERQGLTGEKKETVKNKIKTAFKRLE